MAGSRAANEPHFLFKISETKLRVMDFTAREEISAPYEVDLSLASTDEIKFDDVIGKEALLTIVRDEADRYFNGIINEFTQSGAMGRFYLYQAKMVPSLWLLSLKQNCRIFQNKSVEDIVKEILEDGGIESDRYVFRLQRTCKPKEYCVQYRETDLSFISRLLEEEGIFYFLEHSKDTHVVVFGDGAVNYQPIEGKQNKKKQTEVPFHPPDEMVAEEEAVSVFVLSRQIRSGKITVRDFNFKKPSLDLTAEEKADSFESLEVYDYPGEYFESDEGKNLAKIRLEEAMTFKDQAEGRSVCAGFTSGYTFKLTDHDRDDLNQEYFFVEVTHEGAQRQVLEEQAGGGGSTYSNNFVAIPSSVTFRPERNTPKPVVEGVQTAIVVGPSGEEIYTDEFARVKVKFHWDRVEGTDENSSCWIRVSQLWAGVNWGAMFIPRIGQEVIIDFIEGDPDRPIITGRVYNKTNIPPYTLPDQKTKSAIKTNSSIGGDGFNEIRFEDKKGEEELFIHGQKNLEIRVTNDRRETIGHDRNLVVENDKKETVKNDRNEIVSKNHKEEIGGNRNLKVVGKQVVAIDDSLSVTVGANVNEVFKADHSEKVTGQFTAQAADIVLEATSNITFKVGGSFIAISSSGIKISSSGQIVIDAKASAELTSAGNVTIKGTMVMIN
jgi:type VI secretion system secreted protein VgrG